MGHKKASRIINGTRMYTCQWPRGCSFTAIRLVKRGEHMDWLRLCTHHANQFEAMTNAECAEASRDRLEAAR